jgi:uncharacterized protein involved in exopolysaccharide biosynthesis
VSEHGDVLDVELIISRYWRRRWFIASASLIVAALLGLAALLMRPVYESNVVLAPVTTQQGLGALSSALGQLGGLASLVGVNVGESDSRTEEAMAVLRSRKFTEAFIRELNLMPELYPDKWDAATGKWKTGDARVPTAERAYDLFDKRVRSVTKDKKTGLVTLTIEWTDRTQAASWANTLVQRLNGEMRDRAIAEASASIGYLQHELDNTVQVDTRQAINRLIEAKIQQRMVANVTQEYAFRVVDPAVVADADRPLRPKKLQMAVGGLLAGFFLALALIPILDRWGTRAIAVK